MAKHYFHSLSTKKLLVFLLSTFMIFSFTNVPHQAYAASSTLTPTDDSYVYEGTNAGTNYGSSTTLAVKTASGSNRYAFLKFNLSSVASVNSAKLRVYGSASASTTLNAYGTSDSWSESTLIWNNKPAVGSLINGVPINTTVIYNEIDVTSYVQAQLAGDKTASFVLEETVGKYSTFNSKESGSNIPQLVVDTGTSSGDTQAPTAPANLSATAASSSQINLSWTASTDNVGVSGYNIYRNGTQVGTSTSTSYSDTGLSASTSYSYTVKAKDAAGNVSSASNTASATTASGSVASIDYHIWALQQPDGSTISSSQLVSGYTSSYFYKASDGGQAFMDPKTGATTSGSLHPRSELREQTTGGSNAAWSWTGTNTMTNNAAVTLQGGGSSGRTAIGQMFNSTDSIPLVELMYTATPNSSGGNFQILYEEAKGAGTWTYLSTKVALNTKFTYQLSLSGGIATVSINGLQVYSHTPSFSGKQFYFKAGDYDQTATAGTVTTTPYTIVEFYSINVVHK